MCWLDASEIHLGSSRNCFAATEFFRVTANPNLAQQRLRYPVVMEMDIMTALDSQVCRLHQDSNSLTYKSCNAYGTASISITKDGKCANTLQSVHGLKYLCILCMYLCILDTHLVQYTAGEAKHIKRCVLYIFKQLPKEPTTAPETFAPAECIKMSKHARGKWHSETRWSVQQEQGTKEPLAWTLRLQLLDSYISLIQEAVFWTTITVPARSLQGLIAFTAV